MSLVNNDQYDDNTEDDNNLNSVLPNCQSGDDDDDDEAADDDEDTEDDDYEVKFNDDSVLPCCHGGVTQVWGVLHGAHEECLAQSSSSYIDEHFHNTQHIQQVVFMGR